MAATEWMTFPAPDDDGHQFRVDVSFLLSNYNCIYGAGCPSTIAPPPRPDLGCCAHGVEFVDDEDFEHVASMVTQLTPADSDNLVQIRREWYVENDGVPFKTRVMRGVCIFGNRSNGPAGKPGCAFHHLAARTGRQPADTKPDICWRVPLNYSAEEAIEPNGRDTTIISAFSSRSWGGGIHWWCVEAPEAYSAAEPVYRTFEYELRKAMGDPAYERMVELLQEIPAPRWPVPAQSAAKRLPVIS